MPETYQGAVYFIQHRDVKSSKPHYLIVLNPEPTSSELIVFGVVTSGVELAEKRIAAMQESADTLVKISPTEYAELDHISVVDCNSPVKYWKWEFELSFGQLSAQSRSDFPLPICEAIIRGVMASRSVSQRIKNELAIPQSA